VCVCVCVCSIIKSYCSIYIMVLRDHCDECSGESEDIGKAACAFCIHIHTGGHFVVVKCQSHNMFKLCVC